MEYVIFKILSVLIVLFSLLVVGLNNLVHSVISLIMVFFCFAGVCFLFGFEYIGLMITMIYIGAIAVLFLFIVLMLNLKVQSSNSEVGQTIFAFIVLFLFQWFFVIFEKLEVKFIDWVVYIYKIEDMFVIGTILFSRGILFIIIAGLLLFVAMIGSIRLTLIHSGVVKRQSIFDQNSREQNSVEKGNIKVK